MTTRGELTILMITHKFREVTAYADEVSILRRGRHVGGGLAGEMTTDEMARLMIGDTEIRERAARVEHAAKPAVLELAALHASDDDGLPAITPVDLKVHGGEIVGIAGVSGTASRNWSKCSSPAARPRRRPHPRPRPRLRAGARSDGPAQGLLSLQEEPLKNAAVPRMSVAENMALRTFDKPPIASLGWWLSPGPMRAKARALIDRYRVKIALDRDADRKPLRRQRPARRARPRALRRRRRDRRQPRLVSTSSVAEIRTQILEQRNPRRGRAPRLGGPRRDSELADRVAVMSGGRVTLRRRSARSTAPRSATPWRVH